MESVHESELHVGHGIHRVPLSVLRHDSSAKLSALKAELVDLINSDYASFIGISTALRSYTPLPQGHENTLRDTRNALTSVRNAIQSEADHVNALLLSREKLRDAKAVLKSCIAIHDSVRKLESLLNIDTVGSTDSSDSSDHGKLVERVAIEFNQLLFLVSSIQKQRKEPLAFVKNLQWRIDRIKSALTSILKESLDLSLAAVSASKTSDMTSSAALTQCLRTYLLIDRVRDAGAGVRALVEPELMKLAQSSQTAAAGNMALGSDASSGIGLLKFYKDVIAYIDVRLAKILAVSRQVFGGVSASSGVVGRKASGILSAQADAEVTALAHASQKSNSASNTDGLDYDFLVDEVMVIVWNCVIKYFSGSWNPGLPDLFHRNYLATTTFIESIEKLYFKEDSSGVAHFRMHPSTVDFLKKWNLEVYYRIRVKEVVSPYETTFSNNVFDLIVLGEGSDGFHVPQTVALQTALKKAWSANLFIPALVPGFWKLSLQCLNRYYVWLKAVNDSIANVTKDSSEGEAGVAVSGVSAIPQGAGTTSGAVVAASADGTVSAVAREDVLLQTVAAILGDVGSLFREMEIVFDKTIVVRLPSDFPNTKNLKDVFLKVPQDIESSFVPEFQSKCAAILIKRCQVALEQVSVVVQTTRFSSKVPSVPSTYVSKILLPAITFFALVASKNCLQSTVPGQAAILRSWKLRIMEAVCVKYHAVVSKQLEDAAQLDKFSQRRRVGKAAAAAAAASRSTNSGDASAAASTPFEKIKEQMKLDVLQFKKEVDEILFSGESVEAAMENVAEWEALCSVVGIEGTA
ncbi:Conserved oligomeric Golgi complex subunit 2 [Chytriomyces hyalinus]|nr:Conserved oligomeric Golgi complex subunit 2 [Chytriomyces hyalinus]